MTPSPPPAAPSRQAAARELLRAIPAGRKAIIAFTVDDEAAEVLIYAVTYGGADWAMRSAVCSR